jgi:hypothetical protein
MNEVGMQQDYVLPYDRWEGYAAERRRLLSFLSKKVKNKGIDGKPQRNGDKPCGPFVLRFEH